MNPSKLMPVPIHMKAGIGSPRLAWILNTDRGKSKQSIILTGSKIARTGYPRVKPVLAKLRLLP